MSQLKKILVIGASIAGPSICYWLKKFGFTPTLIEKNKTLRKGGYAIDIRGIAVEVVKKMHIYKDINDRRTTVQHGIYVDEKGNVLHEEHGEKYGFRRGEEVEIVRGDLVEILMDTIKDVPCHFNQSISHIEQHDEHVLVTFKDNTTENFDLIIGTDGLHSTTRRLVFTKDDYDLISLGSYISVFSVPNFLGLDHSEVVFESKQKLVSVNSDKNKDKALAAFMLRSNHTLKNIRDEEEQKNFLRHEFFNLGWETNKILECMEKSADFYFDAVMQVKMKSWTKKRAALVGDSSYCASPLSGQGTSLALVGAYILAGELKAANGNVDLAFERYNTLLHPFVLANQELGVWASKTFLLPDIASKEVVEARGNEILNKLNIASNAIKLPDYL